MVKRQCHLAVIYGTWLFCLGGIAFFCWHFKWVMAICWAVLIPLFEWLYIRNFRSLSPVMGYGTIADEPAPAAPPSPAAVTLYTALGCPFCPLMEERLRALAAQSGFKLRIIDVTLRPDLLRSKSIRSVPTVEADGEFLTGLQTSSAIAAAIGRATRAAPR